jgi:hypothetical protein
MRWGFLCCEGRDRLTVRTPTGHQVLLLLLLLLLLLTPLHEQVLTRFGPVCRAIYHLTNGPCGMRGRHISLCGSIRVELLSVQ